MFALEETWPFWRNQYFILALSDQRRAELRQDMIELLMSKAVRSATWRVWPNWRLPTGNTPSWA
ncbi:MAG: hypothetical protein EA369_07495 [Bradymonadales bacterium]|nr:MAG: hypothetical protein EA369_07495 [Bradymonadales bacterium]